MTPAVAEAPEKQMTLQVVNREATVSTEKKSPLTSPGLKKLLPLAGVAACLGAALSIPASVASGAMLFAAEVIFAGVAFYMLWPKSQKN